MKILIVVDMQNDFIDGALGTKEAAAILENVAARIQSWGGGPVVFTQDTHQDNYLTTPEGKKLPAPHCIEGTHGWQIHDMILAAWQNKDGTPKIPGLINNAFMKPVFGSVELVQYLETRADELTEVELVGVCTDICVISNAIMIKNTLPNVNVTVNAHCCAGVTPQSHTEALNTMKMCQIDVMGSYG